MDKGQCDGAMKKQVHFDDDQLKPVTNKQKRGSVSSSRSSSNSLDDDLIIIEDEFTIKTPSRSPEPTSSCPPDYQMQGPIPSYDSSRIPSAIFSSTPSAGADWSVASNDSLFSLHMGNTSFSKDFLACKSGEFPKLDDYYGSQPGLPSLSEVEEPRRSEFSEANNLLVKDDEITENGSPVGLAPVQGHASGDKSAPKDTCNSASNAAMSPHSDCSNHSFAFPVFSDYLGRNKSAKLDQNSPKSHKKEVEELQQTQSPRKPQKAPSLNRRNWLPRCFCFNLPCKKTD